VKIATPGILRSVARGGGGREQPAASVGRREAWGRRIPLLPALVYVFLVTQIPFVLTIYYSFFSWNLLKPGSFKFAGLDNYAGLIKDEMVRTAVWNTVLLTACVIGISVILGMAVAMLLNSEVLGKGLMRTLMIAPFLIMPTAAALVWKDTLLNPLFGLLPYLLTPLGLQRVDWLGSYPMVSVVTVEVWRWTPFMMLIILAGLQSQNPELLEAARVDGAGELTVFRRVIFPLMMPTIVVVGTTLVIFALKAFDVVYVMTNGNYGTDVLAFRMYNFLYLSHNYAAASAVAVILLVAVVPVLVFNLRQFRAVEARR
jgi:sorbitol/mannitol transport system permease protein